MTLTFNCSLKLIVFHTRNCVDATMCSSPALLTLAKALLGRNAFMLHSEAKDERGYNMWQSGVNWTDQFCFFFFFLLQQTSRPDGAAESKCQMRSCLCLGAATLRPFLSNMFHRCCFDVSEYFILMFFFLVFKDFMCCNFPVCPSVPETLNLWGHIRSQVRSSGTGLHSVSTSLKFFEKINVLLLRITFGCNMSPLVLSWWCQAVWNVLGDAPAALCRVWCVWSGLIRWD